MFNEQANLAGAIQSYLNGNYSTLEEVAQVYGVDIEEMNKLLNPPVLVNESNHSLDEILPNVN